jgi:glucose/arabinose dehydrogenase
MRRVFKTSFISAAAAVIFPGATSLYAAPVQYFTPISPGIGVTLQPVASGLVSPVDVQSTPDNTGRLVVTDQAGKVQIVQGGVVQSTVIDLSGRLPPVANNGAYDERGMLGFVYDPDFNNAASPGFHKVYTYTSEPFVAGTADFTTPATKAMDHQNVVAQWTMSAANPDQVDLTTRRELLRVDSPYFNHDGGPIKFGPDKNLYISIGDGGGSNDNGDGHTPTANPQYPSQNLGNAQDPTKALGKILRIDVRGSNSANGKYGIPIDNPFVNATAPGTVKEVYAYGLRNVFRFSFDKAGTHDLIAGDVGQNNVEEVDKITKGGNYGWHIKEGTLAFDAVSGNTSTTLTGLPTTVTDPNGNSIPLTDPLAEYDHTQGIAIIGGFVYRGSLMPLLQGKYIFGDFGSFGPPAGKLFYADLTTGVIREFSNGLKLLSGQFVKGMGEDANGEVYLTTSTVLGPTGTSGAVFEIVPEPGMLSVIAAAGLIMLRTRTRRSGV